MSPPALSQPWAEAAITGDWVRVGHNVWVLLEHPTGFGGSWENVWQIGLGFKQLEASYDRMDDWIAFDRDVRPLVDPSYPVSVLRDYSTLEYIPNDRRFDPHTQQAGRLRPRVSAWIDGTSRKPVHIIPDPTVLSGGRAHGEGHVIRVGTGEALSPLIDAARLHWARVAYGAVKLAGVPLEWIPVEVLLAAADALTGTSTLLLHELVHIVWDVDFGLSNPHPEYPDRWGGQCANGPKFDPDVFMPGTGDVFPFGVFGWEETRPVNRQCINKHWVCYMEQYLLNGLLKHDVKGVLQFRSAAFDLDCALGASPKDCRWPTDF